jgi:hypothetical protein
MYLGCIWRHLNATVFNGATPMASAIKNKAKEEYDRWHLEKIFAAMFFGFPEPVPPWLLVRE